METRSKATPVVYLLLEKEGKFLIARRYNTGYQDGFYDLPAGHIEEGELPTEALIREAKEEVGIDLLPNNIELVHVMYRVKHNETGDRVDFFFRARSWNGEVVNAEPHKCDDLKWVSMSELPSNMNPHVRVALEYIEKDVFFKELGVDFFKAHNLYLL
jgi:8-oxo-dGTP pyrophosphatase MutT (NUDIX family)